MFDFTTLATYVAIVLGLFLIPGPAVLVVVTRTLQSGRKIGVVTGLGIAAGDLIHTFSAALGLSALLMTSSLAFSVVKLAGACYLIYLGAQAFFAKPNADRQLTHASVSPARAFLLAIATEVLNPKTAMFFLAFLPQFVHPESGSSLVQFAVLGLVFSALSIAYTTLLACMINPLTRALKWLSGLRRWEGKIIGVVFVSLGLKVAMQQR
jgi:threonine/homoserine/homoserine lactone efflux protein